MSLAEFNVREELRLMLDSQAIESLVEIVKMAKAQERKDIASLARTCASECAKQGDDDGYHALLSFAKTLENFR